MTIRLFGPLLCGGLLALVAIPDSFAQSGRNSNAPGNHTGTSRGVLVSPYQTGGHGGGEEDRRRSKGAAQGNPAPKAGLSLNFQEFKADYKKYEKPKGQKRGDR